MPIASTRAIRPIAFGGWLIRRLTMKTSTAVPVSLISSSVSSSSSSALPIASITVSRAWRVVGPGGAAVGVRRPRVDRQRPLPEVLRHRRLLRIAGHDDVHPDRVAVHVVAAERDAGADAVLGPEVEPATCDRSRRRGRAARACRRRTRSRPSASACRSASATRRRRRTPCPRRGRSGPRRACRPRRSRRRDRTSSRRRRRTGSRRCSTPASRPQPTPPVSVKSRQTVLLATRYSAE